MYFMCDLHGFKNEMGCVLSVQDISAKGARLCCPCRVIEMIQKHAWGQVLVKVGMDTLGLFRCLGQK